MKNPFLRSRGSLFSLSVVVLVLSISLWIGCGEQYQTASGPEQTQETVVLSPSNPQVRAVMAIQDRHTDEFLAKPGIVGTATGLTRDGKPVIVIFTKADVLAKASALPTSLEDVPVIVKVTGEIFALSHATGRFARPVPIGVSTGHPNITAGTIACRVKDTNGNVYTLSNNHVYADENNASIGDNILQPGAFDGGEYPADAIGTLFDFEPIVFKRKAKNEIDAAIALSSTANLGTATPSDGYGTPNSTIVAAVLDQQVQKFGRTTELTKGKITGINATVNVGYSSGVAKFVKQIIVESATRFIGGGDSGSLLVTDDADLSPLGLLFAGNGSGTMAIANRIDLVLNRFNVTVDGDNTPPPPSNDPPDVSITSPADGSTFDPGATILFQGTASDTEDGDLSASPVWTSSIDGQIGTGNSFSTTLSDGNHTITAEVMDSGGKTGTASISITVGTPPPSPTLSVTVTTDKASYVNREKVLITVTVTDGTNPVEGAAVHVEIMTANNRLGLAGDGSTDADGVASFQYKVNSKRDGVGTYNVDATASKAGYESGSGSTTFEVTK